MKGSALPASFCAAFCEAARLARAAIANEALQSWGICQNGRAKGSDAARRTIIEIAMENSANSRRIGAWSRGAAA